MRPRRFGREIKDLSVAVDGYDWEECTFTNCEIILARGDLDMVRCHFHQCRLTLVENARAIALIIKLFAEGSKNEAT